MKFVRLIMLLALALASIQANARREPLTSAEIDQIRDTAQEPAKRVPLYVKFIRARATSLEQLRSDPRVTEDRSGQIHDLLDDITGLLDELDDNIDQFADKADLRKALKEVVDLDTDLQKKLQTMKNQAASAPNSEPRSYAFALDNAMEAAGASLDHARKVEQEQQARSKEKPSTKRQ